MSEEKAVQEKFDLKSTRTDRSLERGGKEVEYYPGVYFTIARANTPAYTKLLRETYGPYELLLRNGDMDPEIDAKLNAKVISRVILMGWRGVVYEGEELPFTTENAQRLLLELPDLRDWIWQQANQASNFRTARMAEAGKGSAA